MENNPIKESAEAVADDDAQAYTEIETYIVGAFYALSSLDLLNPMTEAEERFKKNKMGKCYRILSFCIDQYYSEIFPQ